MAGKEQQLALQERSEKGKDKSEKTSSKFQVLQIRNANPRLGTNVPISTMREGNRICTRAPHTVSPTGSLK